MAVVTAQPKHPAKYTDTLLPIFARILREHAARSDAIRRDAERAKEGV